MNENDKTQSISEDANLVDKVKDEIVEETKGIFVDLMDHVFGDFKSFMNIFKTTGYWFLKPLSIDIREHQSPRSKFLDDFRLAKSLFLLLVIFLALDTTLTGEDASIDQYSVQITYLLFYIISLALFIFIGKMWATITGVDPQNPRLFQSYLLYEFCTLFFIQGVVSGVLQLDVYDDINDEFLFLGTTFAVLVPAAHGLYFFFKLNKLYQAKRKVLSLILLVFAMGFYTIIPASINETLLKEGVHDSVESEE